ncbi:ABC transporter substrate-binding protein [Oceanobacillus sp. Castelsardo]|uniref:ABC transporter substrate-binding protein n=1 Tax=Oceanobacillus sp. Castelsardo TaxID=1851204 RepID=UPI0008392EA9|nr:ABC transporter substrate-binding protein [Oceanobacillus sp. Castelsardo]
MKKLISLLFLMFFAIGIIAGCGSEEPDNANTDNNAEDTEQVEQTEDASFPVTITDGTDQEVTIEKEPERIVSLIPSNTEIAFALGLGDKVVGVSDNDNYPNEVADIEKIGGMEFNIEKIISLEPDLVLAHASSMGSAEEGLQQLRDSGIPVLVVNDATNFDQVYDSIQMIGKVTNTQEEAETIITDMKNEIDDIQEKVKEVTEKKSVIFEIQSAPEIYVAGKNTFMDELLFIVNAENAVEEEGWPQLDEEALISYNPDIIITTDYTENIVEQIKERNGWEEVTAVKEDQVFDIDSDLVSRPGPRLVEGAKEIAKAVYPEIFSEE